MDQPSIDLQQEGDSVQVYMACMYNTEATQPLSVVCWGADSLQHMQAEQMRAKHKANSSEQ